MLYELALASVVIGAGYWGWFFLRHPPGPSLSYGAMQLLAAALAALGLIGPRVESAWMGVAGAIGVGAGTCLVFVGPMLRMLARRLVAAERPGLANAAFAVAEVLAPGSGIAEERAVIRAMTEIREGKIEHAVDALIAARGRAPDDARAAIDERIAMLYLTAHRWNDAIAHAEAHLFGAPVTPEADAASLRGALGVAPPLWVELLGAYGRLGNLERAAEMLVRLEDACAGRDDAGLWIHRARVMFLALAGRIDAVRALVRRARHMAPSTRGYWLAVAHERHGDVDAALAAYEKARARSRGRPRALIDLALARLATATTNSGIVAELAQRDARVRDVVARVEAAAPPAVPAPPRPRLRARHALSAVILGVAAAVAIFLGDSADLGNVIRAGGELHGAIAAGQWWRLVTCVLLHIGAAHLLLNVSGLIVLGRVSEELFGRARTVAVFGLAGLAGSIASYLGSSAGLSAGASGAILGLLGAVFAELTLHRAEYAAHWRRGLWGALLVIGLAQVAYGFAYQIVDQWAHVAGLVAGGLLGALLSPHARWARASQWIARGLVVALLGLTVFAGALAATTPLDAALGSRTLVRRTVAGVALEVPAGWTVDGDEVAQPDQMLIVRVARGAADSIGAWATATTRRIGKDGPVRWAMPPAVPLPDGWDGYELVASPSDASGEPQVMRVVLAGRVVGGQAIVIEVWAPESVALRAARFVEALIASSAPA